MKKILLFILAFCALGVFASCKKKKVLTKRTMENIKEDFTFESSEPIFDAYSMDEKSPRNEFRLHSSQSNYRKIILTAKNKTKIEHVSYKIYNASETESISLYEYTQMVCYKYKAEYESGRKKTRYEYPGNLDAEKLMDINPKEEKGINLEFSDLEINSNNEFCLILAITTVENKGEKLLQLVNNGGVFNFKMEYSIYM